MRIISGQNRGTKLFTLEGANTRPTLDRVKEALFSKINHLITDDCIVLDLFSGSGALGLEALSRGAQFAVLCDKSYEAIEIIKKNVEKTKQSPNVWVLKDGFEDALKKISDKGYKFDIIFLDPPYDTNYIRDSINIIIDNNMLNDDGIFVIETDDPDRICKEINEENIDIQDTKKYGRVYLLFATKRV